MDPPLPNTYEETLAEFTRLKLELTDMDKEILEINDKLGRAEAKRSFLNSKVERYNQNLSILSRMIEWLESAKPDLDNVGESGNIGKLDDNRPAILKGMKDWAETIKPEYPREI